MRSYTVILTPDIEVGGFTARVPALPGCNTQGPTLEETVANAREAIELYLEDFRRIGHDLNVRLAEYVPIDLAVSVCIAPEYLRGHVMAALIDALGSRGFFHPDSLTFGDDIYLSAITAVAQAIPGVVSAYVTRLQRQLQPANQEIEKGVLRLGPFMIAQLDSDPNHPDRGRLEINVFGGR